MREIKFRSWVTEFSDDNQVMIDNFCFLNNEENHFMAEDLTNDRPCVGEVHSVMQFTGLKDKNGKEIYDGDIISGSGNNKRIKWSDNLACWVGVNIELETSWTYLHQMPTRYIQVIGNIHENKELLK